MKILALIIVYRPNKDLLKRNIAALVSYVDLIVLWRNSTEELSYLNQWNNKIRFMGDGVNKFLAKPINAVIDIAEQEGYDFLLTMDQDSEWLNFKGFKEAIERQSPTDDAIGIYSPNVNGYLRDINVEYKDIEWVIQSGMLIDLKKIKGLGGFREDYGIYGIDEEFCYWLRMHGLKIRSFVNYRLRQRYGEAKKSRFGFTVYNYSPIVRYFLIRNMIWMKREFPQSTILRRILHVIFDNYRDILLVENDKLAKLKGFTKGIYHGIFKQIPSRRQQILK